MLGKRKKVVSDMCEQLAARVTQNAQSQEWKLLQTSDAEPVKVVEKFLDVKLKPLSDKDPQFYNENKPLGQAIQEAVEMADILSSWPAGLAAIAQKLETPVEQLAQSAEESVVLVDEGVCAACLGV